MVENWAVILGDTVVNVVLWDGDTSTWSPPEGYIMAVIPAGSAATVGWGWDGTNFVAPSVPPNPALEQPGTAPDVER